MCRNLKISDSDFLTIITLSRFFKKHSIEKVTGVSGNCFKQAKSAIKDLAVQACLETLQ